ncbi:MAG TPA: hypothetical protein VKQ06_11455 [Gammaproteobacteria bacterium]|nr:hypothetical protein [Gammaproteobacteria bacterium]
MKKLLGIVALTIAAYTSPALADVGISVRIGEPGFYGQLDIGYVAPPRLLYSQPVVVVERYRHVEPIYLRVPYEHSRRWNRHCARYNACARPVYFVRDDWYRDVYAPRYRRVHSYEWREHRVGVRHDGRHDRRQRDKHRGDRGNRRNRWR